jgi:Carboxypeptidase regulatory-like domain/TonB dependent receptor
MHKRSIYFLFVTLWLLLLANFAIGQSSTGSIVGTVTDPSGAQISDAVITVTNVATGVVRSTVTNGLGAYSVPTLPPGTYRIRATKDGFERVEIEDLVLRIDQVFQRDISMKVGSVNEEVTVKAQTVALATQNPSLGQIVSSQEAVDLPLNGRSFIQLATLSAGTSSPGNGQGESTASAFGRSNVSISVSGQTEYTTDIRIDGIPSKDITYGPVGMQLDVDAISEFNVQRGYSPADVGVGGRINVLTKSGTNELHGSAWEFLRNDVLDTKNYFATENLPYRQNQFGVSVGGPIIKNRLFFFFDYAGFRVRQTSPALGTVPTQSMLAGDFTGLAPVIDPTTGQPFPNNVIPTDRISQFATKYNNFIPPPNTTGASNIVGSAPFSRNDDEYNFRADYSISEKDTVFGRYTYSNSSQFRGSIVPLGGNNAPLNGTNVVLSWTHIFTPNLLNNFKAGLNRTVNDPFLPEAAPNGTVFPELFGLKNLTSFSQCNAPPSVSISSFSGFGGSGLCIVLTTNNYHYIDNLAFTKGRHRMNMGFEIEHVFMRQVVGVNPQGSFGFTGQYTGNPVADYLLGIPFSASGQDLAAPPDRTAIWPSFYFDDTFQVSPKLTITAGLRWSYFQPLASKLHNLVSFNPNVPGGGWLYEPGSGLDSIGTIGPPGLTTPDKKNWAPRFGVAYHLSQNTVIRSSYGIFYQPPAGNRLNTQQTGPPFLSQSSVFSEPTTPTISIDSGTLFPLQSPPFEGPTVGGFGYAVHAPAPYLQTWTLSLQRALPGGILAEAAYVGSKGTHQDKLDDLNRATTPPPPGFTGDLQTLRPFPDFSSILYTQNIGTSSYHALQLSAQKSLQRGLSFTANYTYSKSIDDDSFDNKACRCYVFGNLDKSLSLFDQRHRFVASVTYQLPVHKLNNPFANAVLAGWTVNGITSLQSGFPFSTSTAVDYSERPSIYGWNEPLQTCNGNLPRGEQTPTRWFDTSCFSAPALGTLGNAGFNNLFTNGFINQDLSLLKDIPIRERFKLQFRAEFFNLFNHPNFGTPDGTLEDSTFGQVLSALPGREVQFGAKILW